MLAPLPAEARQEKEEVARRNKDREDYQKTLYKD
jgi:hypothetical protein